MAENKRILRVLLPSDNPQKCRYCGTDRLQVVRLGEYSFGEYCSVKCVQEMEKSMNEAGFTIRYRRKTYAGDDTWR